MKKISIGLAALLSGTSAVSYAQSPNQCCDVSVPSFNGHFLFGATALYLNPFVFHDYVLTYPEADFSNTTAAAVFENGTYRDADPEYDWGYEVYVGYEYPCSGRDVKLTYRHFDGDDRKFVADPAMYSSLFAGNFFNGGEDTTLAGAHISDGSAHSDINLNLLDLDFGQHLKMGCHTDVRVFGGLRYAQLKNHLDSRFQEHIAGVLLISGTYTQDFFGICNQKTRFYGIGPRLGLDLNYCFFGCLNLVGHSGAALIIGQQKSSYQLNTVTVLNEVVDPELTITTTTLVDIAIQHPSKTRVVPNLEAKLGLSYTFTFCNPSHSQLSFEAGWLIDHYWNTVDRLAESDGISPEFRTRHTIDTNFEGPYVTIQVAL